MRKIKKVINNGADFAIFVEGLLRSIGYHAMYYDDENGMWVRGSLVKLKAVADLYGECERRVRKIWERKKPDALTMTDIYVSDDRCMLRIACWREWTSDYYKAFVLLLEYNFTKGYAVCDICDEGGKSGIKYCYCVTLLGAMKLLTDWCYEQYAKSWHGYFLSGSKAGRFLSKYVDYGKRPETGGNNALIAPWGSYTLDAEDVLSGGQVLCGGGVKRTTF